MSAIASELLADCLEVTDSTPSRSLSIDNLSVGLAVVQKFAFGQAELDHFKELAKDRAPIHSDRGVARNAGFDAPIIQGLALATRFSRLIGMYLPGERAILEKVELKYKAPIFAGQQLIYRCTVTRILRPLRVAQLALLIAADGKDCVTGHCQCVLR
jgi:3-hydroxybutyryl-CoA dehydratase